MRRLLIPALLALPLPALAQTADSIRAAFVERLAHDGAPGEEYNSVRLEFTEDCALSIVAVVDDGASLINATLRGSLGEIDVNTIDIKGTGERAELDFDLKDPDQTWTFDAVVPADNEAFNFVQSQIVAGEFAGSCTQEACIVSDGFDDPSIPIPGIAEDDYVSLMAAFTELVLACDGGES